MQKKKKRKNRNLNKWGNFLESDPKTKRSHCNLSRAPQFNFLMQLVLNTVVTEENGGPFQRSSITPGS